MKKEIKENKKSLEIKDVKEQIRENLHQSMAKINPEHLKDILKITTRKKMDSLTIFLGSFFSGIFSVFISYSILGISYDNGLYAALLTGYLIGFFVFSFETKFMRSRLSLFLRRSRFWVFLSIKFTLYLIAILFSINLSNYIFFGDEFVMAIFTHGYISAVIAALISSFLVNLYFTIVPLIGTQTLLNILKGTYHHPKEEMRIFMFLDLTSSTTIAEEISNIEFHRLLNRFFYDFSESVIETRGEIYKYVGDEIIIAWKNRSPKENLRALMTYFQIYKKIEEQKNRYMESFGIIPRFRAGFHYGKVITGEMGDLKKEIVYLGDTVNTSARIQGECKYNNKNLIISEDFYNIIEKPNYLKFDDMGMITLRGKKTPIRLFGVELE